MPKPRILLQLDPDPQPSVFDSVVAVDSDVDQLFRHGNVTVDDVEGLVHGAMFTRGPEDLKSTAIFIGGSNVAAAEALLDATTASFFGPVRNSVMLDPNGSNTTAAAAVYAAMQHVSLAGAVATILGTGPVGVRIARMLVGEGSEIRLVSRSQERAQEACDAIVKKFPEAKLAAFGNPLENSLEKSLQGATVLFAAGPAGVEMVSAELLADAKSLQVAIDLNAVPPLGIAGVEVMDKGKDLNGCICYGAIGVGGMKMKIHKAAIRSLFESNDKLLDAEEIFELAKQGV